VTTRRVDFSPGGSAFTHWKYRQADVTVAISNRVRDVMQAWGLPADRISVIHSAITTERRDVPEAVAALKRRFAGKRVVGTVAALVGHKDLPTLLRAADRIQGCRPDVHFLILGEGALRPELEKQIADLRLANVTLEGFQSDPYSYYPVFNVFAITSNEEGLGSAVLDAFLYGVPVVATAGGGLPEMIRPDDTGVLCRVGDDEAVANGILRLLDDKAFAERATSGARRLLEAEFTVARMAVRYEKVYQALLKR
jgi:glycosyltransferase involved in cell wall biosynthesis